MNVDRARFLLLTTAIAATAASCGDEHPASEGVAGPVGPPTKAVCPTPAPATYANFGKDFMARYCLRCHGSQVKGAARQGAPDDHNFDSQDEVQGLRDHIDQKSGSGPAATNTDMPRSDPKPTTDERKRLSEWLACGAP
ncbi:MAG: c-type cytochrome [Deltaproteobacteria bacterium]|nr:c-type cytochrome [Deltaproteobacteria bacterium]